MIWEQEQRHICYDRDLEIEAYRLGGVVQKFPNHFHNYYVIGFVEKSGRHLRCKNKEYRLGAGDLVLFNPVDSHSCQPIQGEPLDYRAVNIGVNVMQTIVKEVTGRGILPCFTEPVVLQSECTQWVRELYDGIVSGEPKMKKEETFFFLMEQLLGEVSVSYQEGEDLRCDQQIGGLCAYMDEHFAENITLEDLRSMTTFGMSYLLRSFTKQMGISPYRYLQTVRIDRAKKFLEQGILPVEVAGMAGFSDQSHFSNFFKEFIGVTPKQYQRIFTVGADLALSAKESGHERS